MRKLVLALALVLIGVRAEALLVFEQPPDPAGGVLPSSWFPPDGSDNDQWVYDSFVLDTTAPITEVHWRGGYQYVGFGLVTNFTLTFYATNITGSEPDCGLPGDGDHYLARYDVGGTAGQVYAGNFGGTAMYDYQYALPQPFQAAAGVKYWIQIEGEVDGSPFWGMAQGTGGNNSHFRYVRGTHMFSFWPHDAAFSLYTTGEPTYTITTMEAPAGAGTTTGDGAYPPGSQATVVATPNAGWGFVNWTEGGVPVSNAADYTFVVNADRDLVANFMTAYTVTTSAQPAIGGVTGGDGLYNSGASVTVTAAANPSWDFVNWTEGGLPVSTSPVYTFTAAADRILVANFALAAGVVLFDFDSSVLYAPLPLDLASGGLTAHLYVTGIYSYYIQYADFVGFTPSGFGGLCLYPSSMFSADLLIDFGAPIVDFSIKFAPQEYNCNDTATLRVTASMGGVTIGTSTATADQPGTWPTGTLAFSSAEPFDHVLLHYDADPPTCQDFIRAFMVDNMLATKAVASGVDDAGAAPLLQDPVAYPNPFAGETTLSFDLPRAGAVSVSLYDLQGRLVRTLLDGAPLASGSRELVWDGRDDSGRSTANGVYLCRVQTEEGAQTARLVLLKQQ